MSKTSDGEGPPRRKRLPRYQQSVMFDETLVKMIAEMAAEWTERDGVKVGDSEVVRRCVAFTWRHANLRRYGTDTTR